MILLRGVVGAVGEQACPWGQGNDRDWVLIEGDGWALEVAIDKSSRLSRGHESLLIHDGRAGESSTPPIERSGSWLEIGWPERGKLVFCSDRLGTVPVFWGVKGGRAFFSTRLADMVSCGFDVPDAIGMMQMVLLNQAIGSRTVLDRVSIFPCATTAELSQHGIEELTRYWIPFVNEERPAGNEDLLVESGAEIISAAVRRALQTRRPGRVAWPVTGGLDARCNAGACFESIGPEDLIFHVIDMGNFELPIARKIAGVLGKKVLELKSSEFMKLASSSDLDLDSGDFNVGHWRLAGAARELAQEGCVATVDGFFQDILMNPLLFKQGSLEAERDRHFGVACYRAELFNIDQAAAGFSEFRDVYMAEFPSEASGLAASQRFVIENRSRRMVYGIVRLNSNFLDVRTPGLDKEFIDYGMGLPWSMRCGAGVYRDIICKINPALALVEYDKTGLPLSAGAELSRGRKFKRLLSYYANRIWPGGRLIGGKETAFERMLRTDADFRKGIYEVIAGSSWVEVVFGRDIVLTLESQRLKRGLSFDGVGALLTIALLNRYVNL